MAAPIAIRRLRLRLAAPQDAVWIAAEIARPEVHCWLRAVPCPYRIADAEHWVAQSAALPMRRVIERDGRPLGVVSLTGTLGYWLRPEAWGQGVMTEAAAALIDLHFRQEGGPVAADYHLGNAPSARVLHRLGFRETGRGVAQSEYWRAPVEIACLELSGADWAARRAALAPSGPPR